MIRFFLNICCLIILVNLALSVYNYYRKKQIIEDIKNKIVLIPKGNNEKRIETIEISNKQIKNETENQTRIDKGNSQDTESVKKFEDWRSYNDYVYLDTIKKLDDIIIWKNKQ